jgi:hypothetical protein
LAEANQESAVIDQRGRLLRAALGFAGLRDAPADAALARLSVWLDSWLGIGHVVAGMARQGYDLELRRYDGQGWRGMFFPSGFEHSQTSHAGTGWARSPWEAVQRAAGEALHSLEPGPSPNTDWTGSDDSPV